MSSGATVSGTAGRPLTEFEQVLLAVIASEPRSGYGLKKMFNASPASVYQPSPGALYPALRRLEDRGLLRADSPCGQPRHRRRRRPSPRVRSPRLVTRKERRDRGKQEGRTLYRARRSDGSNFAPNSLQDPSVPNVPTAQPIEKLGRPGRTRTDDNTVMSGAF